MTDSLEFSRPIDLDDIEKNGLQLEIIADSQECAALAQRFDIFGLKDLRATLDIRKIDDGETVTVTGRMTAQVTQKCTVLLDPFEAGMSVEIDQVFVRAGAPVTQADPDPDEEDPYDEEIEGNAIDLGEMVAQCLALELDPYPRKPGVEYLPEAEESQDSGGESPFAALTKLKRDDGEKNV